ncbi:MAG TPA: FAD:protein FMN transferase [Candidatus Limnocylindria bacterium]|nr:FAD:protein FMN transferase [Candidatus Limnocylindria bacterium]
MPLLPSIPARRLARRRPTPAAALLLVLAARALAAPEPQAAAREWMMGTIADVRIYAAPNLGAARHALEAALAELRRIDRLMAIQRPESDVSRLNREGARGPVAVDRRVIEVVQRSIEVSRLTGGAFDVTVLPVVRAWGFDGPHPRRPATAPPRPAGYGALEVDEAAATIRFKAPDAGVDLGGIAKGYALDRAREVLRARGVRSAWIDLGGNVATLGLPPGAPRWRIGVRDPRRSGGILGVIETLEAAVSTSSDAERFVDDEAGRAGHVIDPRSGRPANALVTATVVAGSATLADALSTAAVVMGRERFVMLARRLDVEALLGSASTRGDLQLTSTPGLRFEPGNSRETGEGEQCTEQ